MPTREQMLQALSEHQQTSGPSPDQMRQALAEHASVAAPPATTDIKDEMHPDITNWERFNIKNLGNNINSSIAYLQKNHPQMEFRNSDGEVIARGKGEKYWRKLDPSAFELSDISDVVGDIGSGILSGGATAAGGLAGGLGGAMLAGAGSSGALDLLRQGLGKMTGVNQDVSLKDAGINAAFGAAAPLVFGSGATAAQVANKVADSSVARSLLEKAGYKGLDEITPSLSKTAEELLSTQQRGLSRYAPEAMQMISKTNANTVRAAGKVGREGKTYLKMADEIEKHGLTDAIEEHSKNVLTQVDSVDAQLKGQFTNALNKLPGGLNIGTEMTETGPKPGVFQPLLDVWQKAKTASENSPAKTYKKELAEAEKALDDFVGFSGEGVPQVPEVMDGGTLLDLKGRIGAAVEWNKKPGVASNPESAAIDRALQSVYHNMNGRIEQGLAEVGNPGLIRAYNDHKAIERYLKPIFQDPSKTFKVLKGLDNKTNRIVRETMENVDNTYGTKIKDTGDLLQVHNVFGDPSFDALSGQGGPGSGGTIPAVALGGALGGALGSALLPGMGGYLGLGAGGFLGAKIASPAAVKTVLRSQQAIARSPVGKAVGTYGAKALQGGGFGAGNAGLNSIWNLMQAQGEKK